MPSPSGELIVANDASLSDLKAADLRVAHGLTSAAAALLAAFTLAACSGDLSSLQTKPVTGYIAANALAPTGHRISALPDGRIRITATGSQFTPASRLEKIAMARAAEYGVEHHKKFYLATAAGPAAVDCRKTEYIERGVKKKLPTKGLRVFEIDVTYANTPAGPDFKSARETSEALKAELLADEITEAEKDAASAEVVAQCGA